MDDVAILRPKQTRCTSGMAGKGLSLSILELAIIMLCYTVAALRDLVAGNYAMSWIWLTYALSLIGFMLMRQS